MGYAPRDIFNADECGLFYCLAPDTTTAQQPLPGRKKAKQRITFLPCANADGTEKIELAVIGNAKNPRCFKKKSGKDLGFDYHANNKAWLTANLFFEWLERFDNYISRTPGHKFVLLIEKCSAHGTIENISELSNVVVEFLPPNCTSKIQPMDVGVIAALKLRYRRFQMERALDNIDAEVKHIYKVEVLVAMQWFKRAWNDIPASLIRNRWRHTGLLKKDEGDTTEADNEESIETDRQERHVMAGLQAAVNNVQSATSGSRVSIQDLLNPEGENNYCTQVLNDEALVESIIDIGGDENNITEEDADVVTLPNAKEQLKALAICKRIAEMSGNEGTGAVLQWIRRNQGDLRCEVSQSVRQSTIDQFFN